MGAETSAAAPPPPQPQRDGTEEEEEVMTTPIQEESSLVGDNTQVLQKNRQISSMTSLNGLSDDNTLAEVAQPDSVSAVQKEEAPDTMDTTIIKDEAAPQANGEKAENEPADANDISIVEEKAAEEKQDEANEVGFKKIFRFVGFKFTLKKDKSEEKDPVKLLKVKDKEGDDAVVDDATEKVTEDAAQETTTTEETVDETMAATPVDNGTEDTDMAAATEVPAEGAAADAVDENAKEEGAEKEPESSLPSQEATQSSFRKLLSGGLFSNLRKKASIKKTKEEEEKETTAEEEIKEGDETDEAVKEEGEEAKVEQEPKEEPPTTTTEEAKPEPTAEAEVNAETPAPAADNAEQPKVEEEKAEGAEEDKPTTETELLSSQEKAKTHGSPLKKLFNGAGLKKLSTKKHKNKKEAEAKLTESGEQAAELQSSTGTEEAPKAESGPSSPEDSGEHAIESQIESSQETEGEVTSDGEKKKDGILPWSSFKKLVTPKKRVKKSSESDEEAAAEKPAKSATLSSTESAVFEEKTNEEEPKEDNATEEELKTETTDKLVSSTEEPKKKMDTSVSWEALMCMGGPKKRTRKTSDSDDDETKLEEEASPAVGEEELEAKAEECPIVTSTEAETEDEVVPAEAASHQERESAWDTLKRFVFTKNKPKVEEKAEETPEQVPSDGEVQKEESMFSLRKLFPGRKKKKAEQQASNETGTGEEDSDTPGVVPLSEYDAEQTEAKQEESSESAVTQTKASVEDRSPSWIPAIVEEGDGKHDQLSDIPEEADNAATPKSADTTIEEDDEEHHSIPPVSQATPRKRLSLAEVKPVVPTVSGTTTPVATGTPSENAEMALEAEVEKISEIPCQTSVAIEDLPLEEASAGTEFEPATEHAVSQKNTLLEPHKSDEAMAICTGLGTKEIAKVALEKPVMSTAECLTVITDSLCTEVTMQEKPANLEEAVATENLVLEAQVQQVDTTELEPATDKLPSDMPEVENADESEEPETEKIALIACHPEPCEIAQPAELDEDAAKVENSDPIAPTVETTVYTETVEITQPAIEIKEKVVELEQFVAVKNNAPVQEIVQVVTQQSITVETSTSECVIVQSAPCVELQQVEIKDEVEITGAIKIEEASIKDADIPVQAVVEAVEAAKLEASDNLSEEENKTEANVIEEQSMIIAQAVIENAMDKVLEAKAEAPKPTTPTSTEEIPTPVQALITTEEAIETDTQKPVITETHVAIFTAAPTASLTKSPKVLRTAIQVTANVPVEVIESLDGPTESEEKPARELKQAVEVNASEETVMEEVAELKSNSQTSEDPKEVEKEESKEEVDTKSRPVIHMPVQVVLQTATVVEDTLLEEEAVEEFDTNGPAVRDTDVKPECEKPESCADLPLLLEEPQTQASTEVTSASQDVPAVADSTAEAEKAVAADKCAEVMAQVIEVIEEAVKEIEPFSSEITTAS